MIVPNQITVPVRNGKVVWDFGTILFGSARGTKLFGSVRGTKLLGSVRGSWFWYEILVRYYLVRYVVRNFGRKLELETEVVQSKMYGRKKSVPNQISDSYQIGTVKSPISDRTK